MQNVEVGGRARGRIRRKPAMERVVRDGRMFPTIVDLGVEKKGVGNAWLCSAISYIGSDIFKDKS